MDDKTTLGVARQHLRATARDGDICPLCRQNVKIYKRKLNKGMVRALIRFATLEYQRGEPDIWMHWSEADPSMPATCKDYTKLWLWGLLDMEAHIPDKKKNSGRWRVTALGRGFIQGQERVPSHALIYNGRLLRHEGDNISIHDALGEDFDFLELMNA